VLLQPNHYITTRDLDDDPAGYYTTGSEKYIYFGDPELIYQEDNYGYGKGYWDDIKLYADVSVPI